MRRPIVSIASCMLVAIHGAASGEQEDQSSKLAGLKAAAEVSRATMGSRTSGPAMSTTSLHAGVRARPGPAVPDGREPASRERTLAELLGPAALPSDIELRTIGIRRAAERSLIVISPTRARHFRRTRVASTLSSGPKASCPPSTRRSRSRRSRLGQRSM